MQSFPKKIINTARKLVFSSIISAASLGFTASYLTSTSAYANDWEQIETRANNQTVYWNAWGGSETYNAYIDWVRNRVDEEYGIKLVHVKISDTADAVRRVLAEKSAGRDDEGSIDLIWINGENFRQMKEKKLLFGPFAHKLPNFRLVDTIDKPATILDFTLPTDGYESPWGMAQLIFIHDQEQLPNPPKNIEELTKYAKANPGRITYPALPDFTGSTFLKQVLYSTISEKSRLLSPVGNDFTKLTEGLWSWLENIHPYMWREGKQFPKTGDEMVRMLDDGEIDLTYSFNIGAATNAIKEGNLPETTRSYILDKGTIGNAHFVAIPYNSSHKDAAQVVANFLMSPEAQARKQDPEYWGEISVLSYNLLSIEERKLFDEIQRHPATLGNEDLNKSLPEPHSSWMTAIEAEWLKRYGN